MDRRRWLLIAGYTLSALLIILGIASENPALVLVGVVLLAIVLIKTG